MKKFNFNPNVLTAGVALALGLGIATGVSASTSSGSASPSGGVQISNTATADYSVDGVPQPRVTSNAVTVNINAIGSFTLVATQTDTKPNDDKNENVAISSPTGQATFTNTLTNEGNVKDTYTINLTDNAAGIITGVTDSFGFTDETTTPITVTIKNRADGSTASTSTITSGGEITLLPGQYAELSYSLTADGTGIAGDSGLATITATSQYITTNDPTKATLTNEDQAILKLPNFAIVKTAANTNVDYTQATPTIDYTIKVTNETGANSADAVGVLVQDVLPTGLTVSGTPTISVDGTGNSAGTVNVSPDLTKLSVSGVNLTVGSTLTITFKAAVNKTLVSSNSTVKNIATVYDNYDSSVPNIDNPTADIKDSTASDENTTKQPTDTNDSSQDVTFTNRGLTLDGSTTAELPPTTKTDGSNTANYSHNLVNTGNVAENNIVVKIADPDKNNAISIDIDKVSYTINGGTPQPVTLNPNGEFTIPSLPAGQTAVISYSVKTTGAPVGSSEEVTVSVTPETIANKAIAAVTPKTDTTNVEGLKLVKTQAIDANCDKTPDTDFAQTDITAEPGQCIVYKITATNTMTTKQLTNVVISDKADQWNTKATYVAGSIFDSANGTTVAPGAIAQSSSLTLPVGGTGYLQFVVKINGAN